MQCNLAVAIQPFIGGLYDFKFLSISAKPAIHQVDKLIAEFVGKLLLLDGMTALHAKLPPHWRSVPPWSAGDTRSGPHCGRHAAALPNQSHLRAKSGGFRNKEGSPLQMKITRAHIILHNK